MAEYIEREAAICAIRRSRSNSEKIRPDLIPGLTRAWLDIDAIPCADVVPASDLANARSEAAALRRALEDVRTQMELARAERDTVTRRLIESERACQEGGGGL